MFIFHFISLSTITLVGVIFSAWFGFDLFNFSSLSSSICLTLWFKRGKDNWFFFFFEFLVGLQVITSSWCWWRMISYPFCWNYNLFGDKLFLHCSSSNHWHTFAHLTLQQQEDNLLLLFQRRGYFLSYLEST